MQINQLLRDGRYYTKISKCTTEDIRVLISRSITMPIYYKLSEIYWPINSKIIFELLSITDQYEAKS